MVLDVVCNNTQCAETDTNTPGACCTLVQVPVLVAAGRCVWWRVDDDRNRVDAPNWRHAVCVPLCGCVLHAGHPAAVELHAAVQGSVL